MRGFTEKSGEFIFYSTLLDRQEKSETDTFISGISKDRLASMRLLKGIRA